jgi:hypothetical protein
MDHTLYLIQSSATATHSILAKLKQIYSPHDHVVFWVNLLPFYQTDIEFIFMLLPRFRTNLLNLI